MPPIEELQVLGPQSLSMGAVRVVPCLRLLTALEDVLGSLGQIGRAHV